MSEIRDAIIKLVKSDPEIGNAIAAAINPAKIRARRGVAFIDNERGISTRKGSDPAGGDEAGAPGAGEETDPENASRETNAPGLRGVGGGGGGESKTADAIEDVKKGGGLNDVTGDDLTTGSSDGPVKVVTSAIDDPALTTPTGWSDPNTPPDAEAGKSWIIAGESDTYYQSTSNAFAAYQTHNPSQTSYSVTGGSGVVNIGWGVYLYSNDARSQPSNSVFAYKIDTPGGKTNLDADHPTDGVCALSWDSATGKFKGHDLDPDCSAAQKSGVASVYVEASGVRKKISHLENGGFKITDVDSSNVDDPAGYTKIYSSTGILENFYSTGVGAQVE